VTVSVINSRSDVSVEFGLGDVSSILQEGESNYRKISIASPEQAELGRGTKEKG
jgi:hypothetical protein